ncbi:MAG: helix-turn-helix transcriptional regulator [Ruminococcus flavefaciens]|nr:helix-turn-helix transcriptional regulator [Ruminococcus flavefaciens]
MDKKLILARIDELMIEKGLTKYSLKENADVPSIIYQWKSNATRDKDRTPSLRSIEKICAYLGVSLSYFFAMDKNEQSQIRNDELYLAIQSLSDEKKDVLERMIGVLK